MMKQERKKISKSKKPERNKDNGKNYDLEEMTAKFREYIIEFAKVEFNIRFYTKEDGSEVLGIK